MGRWLSLNRGAPNCSWASSDGGDVPCHGWVSERSSAEQVGGKRQGNAITNEGLMIDNRIQAKMSIRKVKGMLTTSGGDN